MMPCVSILPEKPGLPGHSQGKAIAGESLRGG